MRFVSTSERLAQKVSGDLNNRTEFEPPILTSPIHNERGNNALSEDYSDTSLASGNGVSVTKETSVDTESDPLTPYPSEGESKYPKNS